MSSIEHRDQAPNHHAHHPGFSGITGLLAALTMVVGRDGDARLAAERSHLRAGDRLLDIGCGPGAAARFAAREGATVVGVDPAAVMLDLGRRLSRRRQRITFVEGTAEGLPVSDGSATTAWALATVHHWPKLDGGISEVRRALEPGGRFVANERRTRPGATGLASHGWTDEQARSFAELCEAAGFVDVEVTTHRVGRRRSVLAVLARRR